MSAVRLKDIASVAGVDIGTVSHVLNHRPKASLLRPETRARIERIAQDLGYCRNELAASVSRCRSKVLALVSAEMGSIEYTGRVQNGVFDAASDLDYAVTLYHLNSHNEDRIIRKILGWRTAGVVFHLSGLEQATKLQSALQQQGIAYGFANLSHPGGMGVTTDDQQGIFAAVQHLRDCQCQNPAFFTYRSSSKTAASEYLLRRESAYRQALTKFFPGAKDFFLFADGLSSVSAERQQLLANLQLIKANFIDGIICASDMLAFKLLQLLPLSGLQVPADFRLIGFGDLALASLCQPNLSSIAQNFELMGGKITQMLIASIENKISKTTLTDLLLPVELVLRESSPSPNQGVQ
ncbi:MAG: LacI family DNA-binding transcriptional regulator [Lentisphaeria bacterium]